MNRTYDRHPPRMCRALHSSLEILRAGQVEFEYPAVQLTTIHQELDTNRHQQPQNTGTCGQ